MWEWSHNQAVQNVRPAGVFAKVNRLRFTQQGNKFGVGDGDGNVVLWQAANASQSFFVSISLTIHKYSIYNFMIKYTLWRRPLYGGDL